MGTFWGIVIAAVFVALIAVMIIMGMRHLRTENAGELELPSSKDRTQDRGKELERERDRRRQA